MNINIDYFYTKESNVRILDAFMGTGKSSAIRKLFESDLEKKFVFVYPYKIEPGEELHSQLISLNFNIASPSEGGKYEFYINQLRHGKRVVITHAINQLQTVESRRLLIENGYELVIDEAPEIAQAVFPDMIRTKSVNPYHLDQLGRLFEQDTDSGIYLLPDQKITPDFKNIFNSAYDSFNGQFQRVHALARTENLAYINEKLMIIPNIKFWKDMKGVTILTHNFESSLFRALLIKEKIRYEYIDACALGLDSAHAKERMRLNIEIIENTRPLNEIICEDKRMIFSGTWMRETDKAIKEKVTRSLETMICTAKKKSPEAKGLFWTAHKASAKSIHGKYFKLKQDGTSNDFIAFNKVGTNEYRDRGICMYLYDVYLDPNRKTLVSDILEDGYEDGYALNCLLQCIYRGRVRNNQEMKLILPSPRMRELYDNFMIG